MMLEESVLFVDDDPNILNAYKRQLHKVLNVETALGPEEGLEAVETNGPYAVVISDFRMPGMNGLEFLSKVRGRAPDSIRMILTGTADLDVAIQSINEGNIFRFLTKPCPHEVMGKALAAGIEQYRLVNSERDLLENTLSGSVSLLTEILSIVSPEAFGRATRLRKIVEAVANEMRVLDDWELRLSPMLSQVGFISVPPEIMTKYFAMEPLSDQEEAILNRVPEVGSELLKKIPRLESVARSVLYQNKGYDGTGFPEDSVAGEDIPFASRILKVALDLMWLEESGTPQNSVLGELEKRESSYDPRILAIVSTIYVPITETEEDSKTQYVAVSLSELRMGDTLRSNVETVDSKLLILRGNMVTQVLLARLKNYSRLVGIKEPIVVGRSN
jgi:response regulator RpfG family c-di-GMP phosphodiesterase